MTIDDAFPVSRLRGARALPGAGPGAEHEAPSPGDADDDAVLEQAKGVLIFRYAVDAAAAGRLLCLWSAGAGVPVREVAHALVHDICHGDESEPSNPMLVRWLEDRLRREVTSLELGGPVVEDRVTVAIDHSDASLDAVVEAVRRAARRHVPLVLTVAEHLRHADPASAHLRQRLALAVELARALEPDVDVRCPSSDG
ncbi:MAG: hypothetical protein QOK15_993 [Nocardioidaceae bacterium]|nr:hypothetical protein [Nocardioidaceae bacterium]